MTIEYPDYYEKFRCIGGACPDTCCAGWEVDIDEETAEYYLQQEGEFGERLRISATSIPRWGRKASARSARSTPAILPGPATTSRSI